MIRSMTGFGESEIAVPAGRLRVELRTVNHRYLNVNARLPTALARWEPEIREWLRGHFVRGHVNCTVRLEREPGSGAAGLRLDLDRATAYVELLKELQDRFALGGEADLAVLSRFSDIFIREEPESEAVDVSGEDLRRAVEAAATAVSAMRAEEGRRLQVDLEERFEAIGTALDEIAELAPARLEAERDRLRNAIQELAEGVAVDPARLAQEIAILAERWDINEELVRFRSHLALARDLLAGDGSEGVGKRLGFLVQEMHREANTIGSKANHAGIAHRVVAIKEEVERLREQVENIE
ncbi:MAG TPA: YicC/YloC family endoribonuclease [Longimicrobiaceae bacterium]